VEVHCYGAAHGRPEAPSRAHCSPRAGTTTWRPGPANWGWHAHTCPGRRTAGGHPATVRVAQGTLATRGLQASLHGCGKHRRSIGFETSCRSRPHPPQEVLPRGVASQKACGTARTVTRCDPPTHRRVKQVYEWVLEPGDDQVRRICKTHDGTRPRRRRTSTGLCSRAAAAAGDRMLDGLRLGWQVPLCRPARCQGQRRHALEERPRGHRRRSPSRAVDWPRLPLRLTAKCASRASMQCRRSG